ncbi:hypothetical protein PQX77_018570 [Marasmius sp. AFHP31]|nr:hypothetical protein PQX77_018570 [Marasmius sp. AFHP31]
MSSGSFLNGYNDIGHVGRWDEGSGGTITQQGQDTLTTPAPAHHPPNSNTISTASSPSSEISNSTPGLTEVELLGDPSRCIVETALPRSSKSVPSLRAGRGSRKL